MLLGGKEKVARMLCAILLVKMAEIVLLRMCVNVKMDGQETNVKKLFVILPVRMDNAGYREYAAVDMDGEAVDVMNLAVTLPVIMVELVSVTAFVLVKMDGAETHVNKLNVIPHVRIVACVYLLECVNVHLHGKASSVT